MLFLRCLMHLFDMLTRPPGWVYYGQANPHKRLRQLYGPRMMTQYRGVPLGELSPHTYAIAEQVLLYPGEGACVPKNSAFGGQRDCSTRGCSRENGTDR